MRAVIDTNVLLSGLLWHGSPHALIEGVRAGLLTLISSPALLAELTEVLDRPKFRTIQRRSGLKPDRILAELRRLAEIVDPPLSTQNFALFVVGLLLVAGSYLWWLNALDPMGHPGADNFV